MILTPAQRTIAVDIHRFRVVNCGRRTGKTTLAILEMVAKAIYKDDTRVCYIAPTYQQARDIAWQELKKIALPAASNINESRLDITLKTADGGKANISLRGWESIETLRGQRFDFIVIDEIASMRNWDTNWEEVIRPTLTDKKGEVLFISTPKGFNHFYDLYNKEHKDKDYKSFHFTTYDNPHIPKEEIDKAKVEMNEDRFFQEYMADFRKQEGLVYKEFDRKKHVFDDPMVLGEKIAGIDFGFTNPTAVLTIMKDYDRNYWVTNEWYKTNKTNDEIAEYAASQGFQRAYPDPASPAAIEELRRKGVNVREVVKGSDSIRTGIDKIRNLLLQNRLKIHKSCTDLLWEFETYSYPEKQNDRNEYEDPIKEGDHALDALRYAISMDSITGGKAIVNYAHSMTIDPKRKIARTYIPRL